MKKGKISEGIYFECKKCGKCCSRPGSIYYSDKEIIKASDYLGLTVESFKQKFITSRSKKIYQCYTHNECPLFDKDKGCIIYPVRPIQCSSFPFWESNLSDEESINELNEDCPGFGQGEFYDKSYINKKFVEIKKEISFKL